MSLQMLAIMSSATPNVRGLTFLCLVLGCIILIVLSFAFGSKSDNHVFVIAIIVVIGITALVILFLDQNDLQNIVDKIPFLKE